jgi:D-alanyl-lipoteichoic acid acyltransferase DltB (MBOAT superfamily)
MLFPTFDFGVFFVVVFLVSWMLRDHLDLHKAFLLGVSYFFYGYWDWRFLSLLFVSSTINYTAGVLLTSLTLDRHKKWVVGVSVALNLAILGFFKYYGFFIISLANLLTSIGLERDLPLLDVILPIGISFFTFQGISYVIDVYRGDVQPVKRPIDLYLYISFFPQLVAGPIVRAAHFLPQLDVRPVLNRAMLTFGFGLILLGLFKKMIIASYLATEIVDDVFAVPSAYSSLDLFVAAHAFVVQVYCDFSGYSDIAIGVAALLGYRFKKNFDRPLSATTLQELWQRWHISLTSWLRDYLYRPLKGGKRGQGRMYRNLILTMTIAGLWHGAAWTFVIWGALQGIILVIERVLKGAIRSLERNGHAVLTSFIPSHPAVGWFITINLFAITGVFFRAPDMATVHDYYAGLLQFSFETEKFTPFIALLIGGVIAAQFVRTETLVHLDRRVQALRPVTLGLLIGTGLLAMEMLGPRGVAPFIYFQF